MNKPDSNVTVLGSILNHLNLDEDWPEPSAVLAKSSTSACSTNTAKESGKRKRVSSNSNTKSPSSPVENSDDKSDLTSEAMPENSSPNSQAKSEHNDKPRRKRDKKKMIHLDYRVQRNPNPVEDRKKFHRTQYRNDFQCATSDNGNYHYKNNESNSFRRNGSFYRSENNFENSRNNRGHSSGGAISNLQPSPKDPRVLSPGRGSVSGGSNSENVDPHQLKSKNIPPGEQLTCPSKDNVGYFKNCPQVALSSNKSSVQNPRNTSGLANNNDEVKLEPKSKSFRNSSYQNPHYYSNNHSFKQTSGKYDSAKPNQRPPRPFLKTMRHSRDFLPRNLGTSQGVPYMPYGGNIDSSTVAAANAVLLFQQLLTSAAYLQASCGNPNVMESSHAFGDAAYNACNPEPLSLSQPVQQVLQMMGTTIMSSNASPFTSFPPIATPTGVRPLTPMHSNAGKAHENHSTNPQNKTADQQTADFTEELSLSNQQTSMSTSNKGPPPQQIAPSNSVFRPAVSKDMPGVIHQLSLPHGVPIYQNDVLNTVRYYVEIDEGTTGTNITPSTHKRHKYVAISTTVTQIRSGIGRHSFALSRQEYERICHYEKIHGDGQLTFNELDKSYTTLNNVAKEFWIVFQIDHYISNNSLHFDENGWCNVETLLAFPRLAKMGATRDDIIVSAKYAMNFQLDKEHLRIRANQAPILQTNWNQMTSRNPLSMIPPTIPYPFTKWSEESSENEVEQCDINRIVIFFRNSLTYSTDNREESEAETLEDKAAKEENHNKLEDAENLKIKESIDEFERIVRNEQSSSSHNPRNNTTLPVNSNGPYPLFMPSENNNPFPYVLPVMHPMHSSQTVTSLPDQFHMFYPPEFLEQVSNQMKCDKRLVGYFSREDRKTHGLSANAQKVDIGYVFNTKERKERSQDSSTSVDQTTSKGGDSLDASVPCFFSHSSHQILKDYGFQCVPYNEFLEMCLKDRQLKGPGKSEMMCILFQFWSLFLPDYLNRAIYEEFRRLAREDTTASLSENQRYGLECLFDYYSHALGKKFRPSIYKDFQEEVLKDFENGSMFGLQNFRTFIHSGDTGLAKESDPMTNNNPNIALAHHLLDPNLKRLLNVNPSVEEPAKSFSPPDMSVNHLDTQ